MRRQVAALVLSAFAACCAVPAHARTLYWRALDVTANIDADGRLHVVERHSMVFDGDWNGGERQFRVRGAQFHRRNRGTSQ